MGTVGSSPGYGRGIQPGYVGHTGNAGAHMQLAFNFRLEVALLIIATGRYVLRKKLVV